MENLVILDIVPIDQNGNGSDSADGSTARLNELKVTVGCIEGMGAARYSPPPWNRP